GPVQNGWRSRLATLAGRRRSAVSGVYLCGPVGRGKTFLMDLFYASLPFADKRRQHFHRFMNAVHTDLKKFRQHADPLELVAGNVAAETRVICFDELAVADIADAMILGNLFAALFARGVTLVATSNVGPRDLYKDGLQRQRFLPAIRLIEAHTEVLRLDGPLDFRLRALERADVYQHPIGQAAEQKLAEFFAEIAPEPGVSDMQIEVLGRRLEVRREANGIIWFDFAEICDGPRSQADYIEISRCYHTVLVSNVPQFTRSMENQARRFIALVDEFYDRRVNLILSAAVPPAELYAGQKLRFEFQRTKSRLEEMQSHEYLAAPHLP
ncbi:MAG TPA: cell division protein ZapE, partial [Gammaproteobacteria bacterium]|nr:cell division protein ZapE [Gammaproteobacteria bacterium]